MIQVNLCRRLLLSRLFSRFYYVYFKINLSYKWDVPLTFSVEKLTSMASSNAAKYNVSNIYTIVSWINSNQDESNYI